MRFVSAFLVSLVCLVAACNRAAPGEGRYTLVRTGAGELPAPLGERDGCTHEVIGGWVELQADDAYQAVLQRTESCGGSLAATVDTIVDEGRGTYEIVGDSVRFVYDFGPTAGMGALAGDTLVVIGPGQTLVYRRESR